MLKKSLVLVALSTAIAHAEEPAPYRTADGTEWKLAWHDEFDGTSIDAAKWKLNLPWGGTEGDNRHHNNLYASYMMDDDVRVSDGTLKLTTQKRDVTSPKGNVFHFTQGMVTTSATFRQKYGYFEARVKLPTQAGAGLWPAFWTLSDGWPPEMDICEVWTSFARSHQGYAYRNDAKKVAWDDMNEHRALPTDFATYGMEWGPGYQIYNTNGRVTHRVLGPHVTDLPQYILLNSGVDAQQLPTASTTFPNTFEVDYVRVFARPEGPAVLNSGFEGEDLWPWTTYGRVRLVAIDPIDGKQSIRLDGKNGAAEQKLFGLKPETQYRLHAKLHVIRGSTRFGIKGQGADEKYVELAVGAADECNLDFKTGDDVSGATVYCFSPSDDTSVLLDDVTIEQIAP